MKKKNFTFLLLLVGAHALHSSIVQPSTLPEFEDKIVLAAGEKKVASLSEVLPQLIIGVCDQTFTKDFIEKIAQVETKKFTGEYVDHWENGQLKIKAFFKEGKVDGHVHGWYDDGQEAFKAFFYENVKVGIYLSFFPPKTLRVSSLRIARILRYNFEGDLDGPQQSSDYSGRLKTLSEYKHGILHGSRCWYNSDHVCIKDEFYEEGKIVPGKKPETLRN